MHPYTQNAESVKPWVRLVLVLATGLGGSAVLAGLFLFVLVISTFAFDSPLRRTSTDVVWYSELAGTIALGIAIWAGAGAIGVPARHPARVPLLALAGIVGALGAAGLMFGLGLALLGP